MMLSVAAEQPTAIQNDTLRVVLGNRVDGPIIECMHGVSGGGVAFDAKGDDGGLAAWIPENLLPEGTGNKVSLHWTMTETDAFFRAESECWLANDIRFSRSVELAKHGAILRLQCRMANRGQAAVAVESFPVWHGVWRLGGGATWLRGWKALTFDPMQEDLAEGRLVRVGSRWHSSDEPMRGVNPYWILGGDGGRLCVALEWCGGWQTSFERRGEFVCVDVGLPADQAQLVLEPDEAVDGPALHVMPIADEDEASARATWLGERARLAQCLFGGPEPGYPLSYNHWYATRFAVDAAFLRRQIEAMDPYAFDAFIVDAGWYRHVGDWRPDPAKFGEGEFEAILEKVLEKGVIPGVWSCPQYGATAEAEGVDQPPHYEKFIDGYLLDLAAPAFAKRMREHVDTLCTTYHARWWKYDQLFFTEQTRAGVMKNVLAWQRILAEARRTHPDLIIENCQSGGRMINEFVALLCQTHWLRDGGNNGLEHARSNLREALGALGFLFPWSCCRWTNNPDRMDQDDDELTKYYCRSAMAGTWGIVADLPNIGPRQRDVILGEIANYRRLNRFKTDYLYDLWLPEKDAATAGVEFHLRNGGAAVLFYRWDGVGRVARTVAFPYLDVEATYKIQDADTGMTESATGRVLADGGFEVALDDGRMSAIVFVEPAE